MRLLTRPVECYPLRMYKKLKPGESKPTKRHPVTPRFEKTKEWGLMRADLEKGLKPGEALQIILTDEDKAKYRIKNRRTVGRFVQKFLAAHKLPYTVKTFRRDEGDYILVQYLQARGAKTE